uniref:uncharacterized protein LOC120335429 n=1 Tax=Styela clava TaxID=7725 RepID=UPI00193A61B8
TEWSQWSTCSATCGGGVRERIRDCSYGTFEDFGCIADEREEETCNDYECRSWTPWSFVGLCSVTCNIGTRTRFRLCVGGEPGQRGCEGLDQDMVSCNEGSCPSWTPWGSWVECSATCDGGYQERTRACINGDIGDPGCNDEESELRECNVEKCEQPVELECDMLDLALIIDSSSSIKADNFEIVRRFLRQIVRRLTIGEEHTRLAALRYNRDVDLLFNFADRLDTDQALREISNMRYDGSGTFTGQALEYAATNIFGNTEQNREGVPDLAIVLTDGKAQDFPETSVKQLKDLGVKVVVIGVTDQIVESELNAIATDPDSENVLLVGDFSALLEVVAEVTRFACRKADWSAWTLYSACDVTCGRGRQVRTRVCTDGFAILNECVGIDFEAKACNAGPCPRWSEWSFEGPCPVTCGGGIITRTRMCMFGATGVLGCEGEETATEVCATEECPRWDEWSFWTECDSSCGGGSQSRSRFCIGGEAGIRGCYGPRLSSRLCNAEPCSRWLEWSLWSICTRDCDGGIRTRSRICLHGVPGDVNCFGDDYQTQGCNSVPCTKMSMWASWGSCSATCGGGISRRTRFCIGGEIGDPGCTAREYEDRACNDEACPSWSFWASWSSCTVECGEGTRTRTRICLNGEPGGSGCEGSEQDVGICAGNQCSTWGTWSRSWSECSATCGGGIQYQRRRCIDGIRGDAGCPGDDRRTQECQNQDCPMWSPWQAWSLCSSECGLGVRTHTRVCLNGDIGMDGCVGITVEEKPCNRKSCAYWSPWGIWSACTATCGGGIRVHSRICINGEPGDEGCEGSPDAQEACETDDCEFWGDWSPWSPCSATCDGGSRTHARECIGGTEGMRGCTGSGVETQYCNGDACPYFSDWSVWGGCSALCGGGIERRSRICVNSNQGMVGCEGLLTETRDCNEENCPEWGPWESWAVCSASCGQGSTRRIRVCIGGNCVGPSSERRSCNVRDCPDWSEWGEFSECSASCNGGTATRVRICLPDGEGCPGSAVDEVVCNEEPCAEWSKWRRWSSCSATCGGGSRTRTRVCINSGDRITCDGIASQTEDCNEKACPSFSNWSSWSSCSESCGGGIRRQSRTCNNGYFGEPGCIGDEYRDEACNEMPCPFWSEWSEYSACSATCGQGSRTRYRTCNNGLPGERGCIGSPLEEHACSDSVCAFWAAWSSWSQCSSPCGGGEMNRTRICVNGEVGSPGCRGAGPVAVRRCNVDDCPRWSDWSDWGICSRQCGFGLQSRERSCIGGEAGFFGCFGLPEDRRRCRGNICADWSEWGEWSRCSVTCGYGTRTHFRACNGGRPGDRGCEGAESEESLCFGSICPHLSEWTPWSECDKLCDGGQTRRTRVCVNGGPEDIECEGDLIQSAPCNSDPCPSWAPWQGWSSCSESCGGGVYQRERICINGNIGDRGCAGTRVQMAFCNAQACPYYSVWGEWGACSRSCGGGVRVHRRTCLNGNEGDCEGPSIEEMLCNEQACPNWAEWGDWSTCSNTCGGGLARRVRTCFNGFQGDAGCDGDFLQQRECNAESCPYWSVYTEWTACTARCGGGETTRTRTCINGAPGDVGCRGPTVMRSTCNPEPCPAWSEWASWGLCSMTCSGGTRRRYRYCNHGVAGEFGCEEGETSEIGACNVDTVCPTWSEWSDYSDCSALCGGGVQTHERICINGIVGMKGCVGPTTEERYCNGEPCSYWSSWSGWRVCSATCDGGFQTRIRTCINGDAGDVGCTGQSSEPRGCNSNPCPEWSQWSESSECSASCGTGRITRTRICMGGVPGDIGCEGRATESDICNIRDCPRYSEWTEWTFCSVSCGKGQRSHSRVCLDSQGDPAEGCSGRALEIVSCIQGACPFWSDWTTWTSCEGACGTRNLRSRSRVCINGINGEEGCLGPDMNEEVCAVTECPFWGEWSIWSECSNTCGGGRRTHSRECINGNPGDFGCQGAQTEQSHCGANPCPYVTNWSSWGACSVSCGGGVRRSRRVCLNGNPITGCDAPLDRSEECNEFECPRLDEWSPWSACTRTCDGGVSIRTRECLGPDGTYCDEDLRDERSCSSSPCERWGSWSSWSSCDATCGLGVRIQDRDCIGGNPGDPGCLGSSINEEACAVGSCAYWTPWTPFTACGATCGGSTRQRRRQCINGDMGDEGCEGDNSETTPCGFDDCPFWSDWSDWSQCTQSCDGGLQSRNRVCINGDQGQIGCGGSDTDERFCNGDACPFWSEWSQYSSCSVTCGGGSRVKARVCVYGKAGSAGCIGVEEEDELCNLEDCPVWTLWTTWSSCSLTCGGGVTRRSRKCEYGFMGQIGCLGGDDQMEDCNEQPCPTLSDWSEYSQCSSTCGRGERIRSRICIGGSFGQIGCIGPETDISECIEGNCAFFTDWSPWTDCSATCGVATRSHIRTCRNGLQGDPGCEGETREEEICELLGCPFWSRWTNWGECSVPCGGGIRSHSRVCVDGNIGDVGCEGPAFEEDFCNGYACPYHSEWGPYGPCSASCDGGVRSRSRACLNEMADQGLTCEGDLSQIEVCNSDQCAFWENWSSWGDCSAECGSGYRSRSRVCNGGQAGEPGCRGKRVDEEICNLQPCPKWDNWTSWGSCSVSCGRGLRSRFRACDGGDAGTLGCRGDTEQIESCVTGFCSYYDEWSVWRACSQTCGGGVRERTRNCIGTGLTRCVGPNVDRQNCNSNPCPEWQDWTEWTDCSTTCGGGLRSRDRICIGGIPGMVGCEGEPREEDFCNGQACSYWSSWGPFGDCSATCGVGRQTKTRRCISPLGLEGFCSGDPRVSIDCNVHPCPSWSLWEEWSICSVSCGSGFRYRERFCNDGHAGDVGCEGARRQDSDCNSQQCVFWNIWSQWSECSVDCGQGVRTRFRSCANGEIGEPGCKGDSEQEDSCTRGNCPFWSNWRTWSGCSETCGGGERTRSRRCINGVAGEEGCTGDFQETDICNIEDCPFWAQWGEFTACSVSCGGGIRRHTRVCINGDPGDFGCGGSNSEEQYCNGHSCPYISAWSAYGACSVTCGGGVHQRSRKCVNGDFGNVGCIGEEFDFGDCNEQSCPQWREWTEWSVCDRRCGGGSRERRRTCANGKPGEVGCEGRVMQSEICNVEPCPGWTEWESWSGCSVRCGGGIRTRVRVCAGDADYCLGPDTIEQSCNPRICPSWASWQSWSECSSSCGGGIATRTRVCLNSLQGEFNCDGDTDEIIPCNSDACPGWSLWESWSECTRTCGGGSQAQTRECINGRVGVDCRGARQRTQECNSDDCAVWLQWGIWSSCSASCGKGTRTRSRICSRMDNGDFMCEGPASEEVMCIEGNCPYLTEWTNWSDCDVTCGSGTRRRDRVCVNGVLGEPGCDGPDADFEDCAFNGCPTWTSWTPWGLCSNECGGGVRSRSRVCMADGEEAPDGCRGIDTMGELCNQQLCPRWSEWSDFGTCSATCDGGQRIRYRTCINGLPGVGCPGRPTSTESCSEDLCPTWTSWTEWSACSVSCNGGIHVRTRQCSGGDPGVSGCLGSTIQQRACNLNGCPFWSVWSGYGACNVTCGGGERSRRRMCINGEPGSDGCFGSSTDSALCDLPPCASWTPWGQYPECPVTCGGSQRIRRRTCVGGIAGAFGCEGPSSMSIDCNILPCPSWSLWENWSECSADCGSGRRTRQRICRNGAVGDRGCTEGGLVDYQTCNEDRPCPSWSTWGSWSFCSASCGQGSRSRERICLNILDEDDFTESYCPGSPIDMATCVEGFCPFYAEWGTWSECTQSCDGGTRQRFRKCVNGDEGDDGCLESSTETQTCNNDGCPIWSQWTEWASCTVSCGGGIALRSRSCLTFDSAGNDLCRGSGTDEQYCNGGACPYLSAWSRWGQCSARCGGGFRVSTRFCINGEEGEDGCFGLLTREEACNEQACPIWNAWNAWSECSSPCGGGVRNRFRSCVVEGLSAVYCDGPSEDSQICNNQDCVTWTLWSSWTDCDVTCGRGNRVRSRTCDRDADGEFLCPGEFYDSRSCIEGLCPYWDEWTSWTDCSTTCAAGERTRIRRCVNGDVGEEGCEGSDSESGACNENELCPFWTEWNNWNRCSLPCGGGVRTRSRFCENGLPGDIGCFGISNEREMCNNRACPFMSQWGAWSQCDRTCGGGSYTRTRVCVNEGDDTLSCEGTTTQTADCNSMQCPIWEEWSAWSTCSRSCGGGRTQRFRTCSFGLPGDAGCDGDYYEIQNCNIDQCAHWATWTLWSRCSVSCGVGTYTRERICLNEDVDQGRTCPGDSQETDACTAGDCPFWSNWSDWSDCNAPCNGGLRKRNRNCVNGYVGQGGCVGRREQSEVCNDEACPSWSGWSSWGSCSEPCGLGITMRTRTCSGPFGCSGDTSEEMECFIRACASWSSWGRWSRCSERCDGGISTRSRICFNSGGDTSACGSESATQQQPCNSLPCARWSDWSEWSDCDAQCDGGSQTRSRTCIGGTVGDIGCRGRRRQSRGCNEGECTHWSAWNSWSICDVECGRGTRSRSRTCIEGVFGICEGEADVTESCFVGQCASWNDWAPWTSCSASCGSGSRTRRRGCMNGIAGEEGCEGADSMSASCNNQPCPAWSSWSNYTECSEPCGGGLRRRSRTCISGEIGDFGCQGAAVQQNFCNGRACPFFSSWGAWRSCSVSCGGGYRVRERICINGFQGQIGCDDLLFQQEDCNMQSCPAWGSWTDWGVCSADCDGGFETRTRICIGGYAGQDGCNEGTTRQQRPCNSQACAFWQDWVSWSRCSVDCGVGQRTRSRVCFGGEPGSRGCIGSATATEECTRGQCAFWAEWSNFGDCSVSCGGGVQYRSRRCINGAAGGPGCLGSSSEIIECADVDCPTWSRWSDWTSCSVSCAGGLRSRTRTCTGADGPEACNGEFREEEFCNGNRCPEWSNWSIWAKCSATCDGGVTSRTRICVGGSVGDLGCIGDTMETDSCNNDDCPVFSFWSTWTTCSTSCGRGTRTHTRVCLNGLAGSLGCDGPLSESELCNPQDCPSWADWASWSSCSTTCGAGDRTRFRTCVQATSDGSEVILSDDCAGSESQVELCIEGSCPYWMEWSSWSGCSVTCGENGRRTRTRFCVGGDETNDGCDGPSTDSESCNELDCPFWSEWTAFTECDVTCGGGKRSHTRICLNGKAGDVGCVGPTFEESFCNGQACPFWSKWSAYGECSQSCGGGEHTRQRTCIGGEIGDAGCQGLNIFTDACSVRPCPIWTDWTLWTECSKTCGSGVRYRSRSCEFGRAYEDGCQGSMDESEACSVQACPIWSAWSEFEPCNVGCGRGSMTRTRTCIGGSVGELGCLGPASDTEDCIAGACAFWSEWGIFSSCSVSCGGGTRQQTRRCVNGKIGDTGCEGRDSRVSECNDRICPTWAEWGDWSICSEFCNGGNQIRRRVCNNGEIGQLGCDGPDIQERYCNGNPCAYWSEFGYWSACSISCGGGVRTQNRICINGVEGDPGCEGEPINLEGCNPQLCPEFEQWGTWGECSAPCNGGVRSRTRGCVNGNIGDEGCDGRTEDMEACSVQECPSWTRWSTWGTCSVTCATGTRMRTRICNNGEPGDPGCPGPNAEEDVCVEKFCPFWGVWTKWSSCSVSCFNGFDTGLRIRFRDCIHGRQGDIGCVGPVEEQEECSDLETCPDISDWGPWGQCSKSCGVGKQSRFRECLRQLSEDVCEYAVFKEKACNLQSCPYWSEWGGYGACSEPCDGGAQKRIRVCINGEVGQDGCTGVSEQSIACNLNSCRNWAAWGPWGTCSVSCDVGTHTRARRCQGGEAGSPGCEGSATDSGICGSEDNACPFWELWSSWSSCSVSCGGGRQSRSRNCVNGYRGVPGCEGPDSQTLACNQEVCGSWASWLEWETCTVSCGGGVQVRDRICIGGVPGDRGCTGPQQETERCNGNVCESWEVWGPWSECSDSCGGGEYTRSRVCVNGKPGDPGCPGDDEQFDVCNLEPCGTWGSWLEWAVCTVSCGGGTRTRGRICVGGLPGQGGCIGGPQEIGPCNGNVCERWSLWSQWSSCDLSCGSGLQTRNRECIGGSVGDPGCPGEAFDNIICNAQPCPRWGAWMTWSSCTVTCGLGTRIRDRLCVGGEPGMLGCEGELVEEAPCNGENCESWANWGPWSECDASCGGGIHERVRECVNGEPGDPGCQGDNFETNICSTQECGTWASWLEWGTCTVTCGGGIATRNRICIGGVPGDFGCQGPLEESQDCNGDACEFWAIWGPWGECDRTCGGGSSLRFRECINGKVGDVGCQGDVSQLRPCNSLICPEWASWLEWGNCDVTCGSGIQSRNRVCIGGVPGDIGCDLGGDDEIRDCSGNDCDFWAIWGPWSVCDQPCGTGLTTRTRECINGIPGEGECQGSPSDFNVCNSLPCAEWATWLEWETCTVSCGRGTRTRNRICIGGEPGTQGCVGPPVDTEDCNAQDCEFWAIWGSWGECDTTCGGGIRLRFRECINGNAGDDGCVGEVFKQEVCSTNPCPVYGNWLEWERCTVSCGGGTRLRRRICIGGQPGDIGCEGRETMDEPCNENLCAFWQLWGSWSSCDVTCGRGLQIRTRGCFGGELGDPGCQGASEEFQECSRGQCSSWEAWVSWTPCSVTCGTGISKRARACQDGVPGSGGCIGDWQQDRDCNTDLCATWSEWTEFSPCDRSCGDGFRQRGRQCLFGSVGDPGCIGDPVQPEECNEGACPEYTQWTIISECSATCNGGVQQRFRQCLFSVDQTACNSLGPAEDAQVCATNPCPSCELEVHTTPIENGQVVCTEQSHIGSVCNFQCDPTHQLVGLSTIFCGPTQLGTVGVWNANTPICRERCNDEADIVFVIDSSSSIKTANFEIIRRFVRDVVQSFEVGPTKALFGALRYNEEVDKQFDLKDYKTKRDVLDAVTRIPYLGKGTKTGKAINYTRENMFTAAAGHRPGVPKIAVVVTDGIAFDDVQIPSQLLKGENAIVIAVGIGNIRIVQIYEIASDPDRLFATTVSDFDALDKVVKVISDQIKFCTQEPVIEIAPCPPQAIMDLVLILDSSSSIGDDNFGLIRQFIKNFIGTFNIGRDAARFGLIRYNNQARTEFNLGDHNNLRALNRAVDAIRYNGAGTRTGNAIQFAIDNAFTADAGRRNDVPLLVVLFTDGRSSDDVIRPARALKEIAKTVISIGVGATDRRQLRAIASQPVASNTFELDDFQALDGVINQIATTVCFGTQEETLF